MKLPKHMRLEVAVAGLALAAAAAFAHASASGQAVPIFTLVEQRANQLSEKLFLGSGQCATCHLQPADNAAPAPAALPR